MILKTKMMRKEKNLYTYNNTLFFNKIYTSKTRKTRSLVKCVLLLKSRLQIIYRLLVLLYILSLEISSLNIKYLDKIKYSNTL